MSDREQKIRERAHAIWEAEGRPEGRESEHWERAMRDVDAGDHGSPGALSNRGEQPAASVGQASGLQRSGVGPGGGPGAGAGSIGSGGGSTAGASTGSVRRNR